MPVKAELAFDVCWEVYRGAREVLETKRGLSTLDWKEATKFLWRPDIRPRLNEYVADFALAGQAALDGPDRASRMVMFRLYYLGLAPYENARHFLGLSERSWVNWSEEVRHCCGKELLRRGMFPPRKFRECRLVRVLGQEFVKLPVLAGGPAKVSHRLRPDGALRWSNQLNVNLHGPLQHEAHRLAVFRSQLGEFGIKLLVNFRTDFYRRALCHTCLRFS
jgi:hypothetical protein